MSEFWYYFKLIAMICLILGAALFVTRYSAKVARKGGGFGVFNRSDNIKLIDSFAIAKDKQLLIVSVAGRAFLLSVSSDRIEKLEELDLATLKLEEQRDTPEETVGARFKTILMDRFGNMKK